MNTMRGRRIVAVLAVCALSLSLVAATPSSADAAQVLQNEQTVNDVLTGNRGGAFAYYAITYPGDESVVTIEMRFAPADPVTKAGVGLNVYGPNGYFIGEGIEVEDTAGDGVLQLQYADNNPATWLIQVYNYIPDATISYQIMVEGLPAAASAAAEPAAAAAAEPAAPVVAPLTDSGYLLGNAGGAYAFHEVTVSGDSDVEVTLNWAPDDPVIATGVGFVVYGPAGEVSRGAGTGTPGERRTTLPADNPGTYLVQVYNYINPSCYLELF